MSTCFDPIKTADITWVNGLPYANAYADIYFSADNGLKEAMHVFIEGNQLIERWQGLDRDSNMRFVIGETGFGTGLNFLLAWSVWDRVAPAQARLHFITCEQHPLSLNDLQRCLALWPELGDYAQALLAAYPVLTPGYHRLEWDEGRVTLDLMLGDALACYQERLLCGDKTLEQELRRDTVDAWFLDGFSPNKNPEMWSDALFSTLFQLSTQGTTLSTFSAAGSVKSGLRSAGFEVTKRAGYGQKRDMCVAQWIPVIASPRSNSGEREPPRSIKRKTPWHVSHQKPTRTQQAIVIGGGLSGCFMAYALARRGWEVRLLDNRSTVGQGASGNHRAILFPNVSAYRAPLTELMLSAFLYAAGFYQKLIARCPIGNFSGILQLISGQKTDQTQADLASWLNAYPELGQLVDAQQASALTGVDVLSGGLWIPMAGWMDSPALCEWLIQRPGIHYYANTDVQSFDRDRSGQWCVAGHAAEVVIIANGHLANHFSQTQHLEMKTIRGQMTGIEASQRSRKLQIPLCGDGHILPHQDGIHTIGATFGLASQDDRCLSADDEVNRSKINNLPAHLDLSSKILTHWAGIRGAALDHLPLVGPVADARRFTEQFASQASNAKQWVASGGEYLNGLYIAAGFGSRGLTTIPLCAEYLAGLINHEPSNLPQRLVRAISPARFLHRGILRGEQ